MIAITKEMVHALIKVRTPISSKNTYGHALLVAGSKGKIGAAVIAATACYRAGCGLLTVSVPYNSSMILHTTIPEALLIFREKSIVNFSRFTAAGIGPGIGITKKSTQLLLHVFKNFKKPLVIDADAITIVAAQKKLYKLIPVNTIITPHYREFDSMFGVHDTTEQRMNTAIAMAATYSLIIVLKGHQTIITNGKQTFVNNTGNTGLAKAGSGDALTGMITSFLAQGYAPIDAAIVGVYLHGLAADITLQQQSVESMLITDVITSLGKAFKATSN